MTVYRFGVGKYIKSHKICSIFWKAVLFQGNVIIKLVLLMMSAYVGHIILYLHTDFKLVQNLNFQ